MREVEVLHDIILRQIKCVYCDCCGRWASSPLLVNPTDKWAPLVLLLGFLGMLGVTALIIWGARISRGYSW